VRQRSSPSLENASPYYWIEIEDKWDKQERPPGFVMRHEQAALDHANLVQRHGDKVTVYRFHLGCISYQTADSFGWRILPNCQRAEKLAAIERVSHKSIKEMVR